MSDPTKTKFVGLDVHKDTIVIAVADGPGGGAGDRDCAVRMEGLESRSSRSSGAIGRSHLL